MSSEVSQAMEPVVSAPTVQQALDLMVPSIAGTKGAFMVGNGTDAVASPVLADGNMFVGDHTQATGLKQVAAPSSSYSPLQTGVSSGGAIDLTAALPRIVVDAATTKVNLPGTNAGCDLTVVVPANQATPVQVTTQVPGINCPLTQILPGQSFTFAPYAPTGTWYPI